MTRRGFFRATAAAIFTAATMALADEDDDGTRQGRARERTGPPFFPGAQANEARRTTAPTRGRFLLPEGRRAARSRASRTGAAPGRQARRGTAGQLCPDCVGLPRYTDAAKKCDKVGRNPGGVLRGGAKDGLRAVLF